MKGAKPLSRRPDAPEPPGQHDWEEITLSHYRCPTCKMDLAFIGYEYCWRFDCDGGEQVFDSRKNKFPMSCKEYLMDEALK